ncbi:patatin-like phospholipase family protein [Streptomyces sp. NPDC056224]|uniref:patatin-like phospholipase family protein n=1 Tax=Streptomyces sp. NPDC056224 TaxID=3345750 RepID=UPI0035D8A540
MAPLAPRALVLGPGGHVGAAWMAGLAYGLHRDGVDLGEADPIVGTSAGAIVGALLATGQNPGRLATSARPDAHRLKADPGRMGEVFAVLGDRSLEPGEARRRVGMLASPRAGRGRADGPPVSPRATQPAAGGRGRGHGGDHQPRSGLGVRFRLGPGRPGSPAPN